MHSYLVPLCLTSFYLVSLPLLKSFTLVFLKDVDTKALLKESMVVYNVAQVVLNGWMVYRFIDCVLFKGHPFIGDLNTLHSGTTFAVWVHYCDKYLEFFDTYFMVLRGRMDQVSFLHVYHHVTIAWAWYAAMNLMPGGDAYFGALFNSWIHVMMYSYYALSLLKFPCPWKRYLTMAQLFQFASVIVYTACAVPYWYAAGASSRTYIAAAIQVFEMTSLFILFMAFYKKSYSKKSKRKTDAIEAETEDDQCQVAMATATETVSNAASAVYATASKDANKMIRTAINATSTSMRPSVDGLSRPM